MPNCIITPEKYLTAEEIRRLWVGKIRVIYAILKDEVLVLCVGRREELYRRG